MLKSKRLLVSLLAVVFLVAAVFSGCTVKDKDEQKTTSTATAAAPTTAAPTAEPLKEVELVYYYIGSIQPDIQTVNDELSRLVKAKINATVKMNCVDWGDYEQKMGLIMASGEVYDLCFTSTWANNYYLNAAKGAYIPLDALLQQYAPTTLRIVPKMYWDAATVGGKICGVSNFQMNAAGYGIQVQKSLADKYAFDWRNAKSMADCTPFLEKIKKNEPDMLPFCYSKAKDTFVKAPALYGMEAVGDNASPGWIYLNDSNLTVINQFDTPEFKAYVKLMRDWFNKGYIRKDAATLTDASQDVKAGKVAVQFELIDVDTIDYEALSLGFKGRMYRDSSALVESYDKRFVGPLLATERAACTLTAISVASKNPERAMMFIELLNSDKQIINTISWGIEGKHYTMASEPNMIDIITEAGYTTNTPWAFGYVGNTLLPLTTYPSGSGEEINGVPKAHKLWIDINTNAEPSHTLGFVFNYESVKGEIANCKAVIEQYHYAISSGSVDPDKYVPEMIQKLKTAGMDTIIAEKQKQIDAWKASR